VPPSTLRRMTNGHPLGRFRGHSVVALASILPAKKLITTMP